ncbi:MAG TPA: alpha-hydroxy acid oxidase [Terriglobales bacterium]|jgi:L-lactate dehydrogenase (cytochrome)|nr:alpha-hydroxy acid oxidase [Terriglobales bacterium]
MKFSPSQVVNISDLRRLAEKRVPRAVFDYLDGGAESEITLGENTRAFRDILFRPRQAVAFGQCGLSVTVLGSEISFPAMLAPVGYSRMMHPGGEVAAASAAGEAGTGYILSTISGHKLENVKAATTGPAWYQLYLVGGRPAAEGAIERAQKAGFSALVITVDTAVAGLRERDPRNGMKELLGGGIFSKMPFLPEVMSHPQWLAGFLMDGGLPKLENIVIPGKGPMELLDVSASLAQSAVSWADFSWIRQLWKGPLVVKGILTAEDARRAVSEGAAAVVVSNHGGRQLDEVYPTIRALPEVVAAVADQTEVLMDGGIRRGTDIVKALCLGARAVLIGRAYAYGLAAGGYHGVKKAIQILWEDVERTMRLLGCPAISDLNESYIEYPREWKAH